MTVLAPSILREYDIRGVVHSGVREMTKLMLEVIR